MNFNPLGNRDIPDLYQLVLTRDAVMIYGCWIFIDMVHEAITMIIFYCRKILK